MALVTWRITSLLVREHGPLHIFSILRDLLGVRFDERSLCVGKNPIADMLCCFKCASVWVALVCVGIFFYTPALDSYVVRVLAVSSLAILFDGRNGR